MKDVLMEADFSLDFFDSRYITPDIYRFVGSDFHVAFNLNPKYAEPEEEEKYVPI